MAKISTCFSLLLAGVCLCVCVFVQAQIAFKVSVCDSEFDSCVIRDPNLSLYV